jgi:hypothetical protein
MLQQGSMDESETKLREATRLHHRGRLDEAGRLHEAVLGAGAGNFDALRRLGILRNRRSRRTAIAGRGCAAASRYPVWISWGCHMLDTVPITLPPVTWSLAISQVCT